mgnify:CR=1 FL=1|tara:strand:- start:1436 stop:1915 length:480 start_codon:yes stop_codon:yes gene_type:complete
MAKLTVNETSGDFTHVVVLDSSDLVAIGNGGTKEILKIGANQALLGVYCSKTVDGFTADTVINIGTTIGDPHEFFNALDIGAATVGVLQAGSQATTGGVSIIGTAASVASGEGLVVSGSNTAADKPVYIKVTDADISGATAGELVIGFRILDLGRFSKS